ncbi:MAG: CpXC domain-containing protein [Spirochaetia bacterium]|nr:CpXC domain-containing protein [Spirochaetia bacterium]
MKVKIPCHCGNIFEFEYDEETEITPETADEIIHGRFMNTVCDKCGITLKPEFPVMFSYPDPAMKIFFVPELQRDAFLREVSPFLARKADRFVIGFQELAEKIKILEAGLDDISVECVKYYILSKIENDNETEDEIRIFFEKHENEKLMFSIHGLKKDEIGILSVDMNFYNMAKEKAKTSIKEEPFKSFLTPPYISILKIYREYNKSE